MGTPAGHSGRSNNDTGWEHPAVYIGYIERFHVVQFLNLL